MKKIVVLIGLCILPLFFFTGCATYYQKNQAFYQAFESGNIDNAEKIIVQAKSKVKPKDRLLYLLNRGVTTRMLGDYRESIKLFGEADHMIEDYSTNYGAEALALISNPMATPYRAEDFEKVLIHFYQALNYIDLKQYDDALVECRRINLQLYAINDKYPDHKNRYQDDAFAQLLTGLIYDALKDYNNAFISYRNAYNVYQNSYAKEFGLTAPEQLKHDLVRTAALTGFGQEQHKYEAEFGFQYQPTDTIGSSAVFFWLNGLGPVKSEWSVNFALVKGEGGWGTFVNDEYGLSFPVYLGGLSSNEKSGLNDLRFIRVAMPRYSDRQPVYNEATLTTASGKSYPLEIAEDIDAITHKTLHDRLLREMGKAILRLAAKKSVEAVATKKNDALGMLVSLANAVTEKADTRNWQTLPYEVGYIRIPLKTGSNNLTLHLAPGNQTQTFNVNGQSGETRFITYHTLESFPPKP
ncbi:hypothetical protein PbJCM13498_27330 [Prolixibacter bellariivorans]|uniref:Tetratricopeptide repeat protein n=1 Tax=Prolixibacter bellariivorans TaxID=314319 RepID=A0A5M4B128_9BACT|nr:hypothetical protein [Prolixibacter bellariivorans]GET33870.1 hypothetical protein PbJCM13498_27330 [Prolixibacter bellariivorans]